VGLETVDESLFADDNSETQESTPIGMFLDDDIFPDDEDFKLKPHAVPKQQPLNIQVMLCQAPSSIAMVRTIQNQPSA
jgi:hypothetical protein